MKKIAGVVIVLFLALSTFIVVILGDSDDDLTCTPNGSGGVGGSGIVNSDGLAFPVASSAQFTSGFGERWGEAHNGVDYAGPIGTEIYAFADGVVAAAGPASGFGNWIVIDHKIDGEDHSTVYGHMSADNVLVSAGDTVKAGDHIAGIGSEGYSTGPHLHFEYYNGLKLSGGTPVDPQPMLEEIQADGGSSDRSSDDDDEADEAPAAGPSAPTSGGNTNEGQDVSLGVANDPNTFDERQLDNVRAIIQVGKDRGAPESVIKAALMAAGPESGYRMLASRAVPESLTYPNDGVTPGDATSVGIYQIQTPMNMPVADAMDRTKHISWFYDTAEQLASPDQHPGEIAANVERPREDLRGKYMQWEETADVLLESEGNISPSASDCAPGGGGDGEVPADLKEFADNAVEYAREHLGLQYSWGGGDWNGPTKGVPDGGVADSFGDYNRVGFDCSGLTMYAYAQASGMRVKLPHYTTSQQNDPVMTEVNPGDIAKGDLLFFGGADPHHVAMATSATTMIHAPQSGDVVKEQPIAEFGEQASAIRRLKEIPSETTE
ncbi:peptidoglycan DD-metalloendopeptidase family protein [Corynebacterium sp. AOP40-9SA-29]|uniref:peptidoglycan DD-metalloendopeptidase family protein n=1 Tax=Corynebacterium sp. AOP40-9SA-29 TaxID=3457677 RepID=UPI004033E2BF